MNKLNRRYYVAAWMLQDWHPRPSMFEQIAQPSVEELRREGDSLRRKLEGRRVLDAVERE